LRNVKMLWNMWQSKHLCCPPPEGARFCLIRQPLTVLHTPPGPIQTCPKPQEGEPWSLRGPDVQKISLICL
jgi:hypothetical protein